MVAFSLHLWYNAYMDKDIYSINDSKLTYGRGYVYSLQYHIVWCVKYRRSVLVGEVEDDLKACLYEIAAEYGFRIVALETMPDHVHMLVDCRPQFFPSDMIKIIKGNTARRLFIQHPELKTKLWGGHLWNPSYCIVTVSDRSFEMVRHYIESQKEESAEQSKP